jgi:nitroimidazol reductase NimA-like FMN-containing flavoprotein (pyridoxamine 5'-phosphate oxidase superfamily)
LRLLPWAQIDQAVYVDIDSVSLKVLSPGECLALAATVPIGRIVFTEQALPAVQPVNFVLDDGCVIIRTGQGSKLAVATRGAIVAFEVDDFDPDHAAGWSVTMVGRAEPVHDPIETARLSLLPLRPWAPGRRDRFIRIRPARINGHRLLAQSRPNGSVAVA